MRLYSFVPSNYIRELQWGNQSLHALQEMHNKYRSGGPLQDYLFEWGKAHKTHIMLNGGTDQDLHNIVSFLMQEPELKLPWCYFKEPDMNHAVGAVSVVVPREIYAVEKRYVENGIHEWEWQYNLNKEEDSKPTWNFRFNHATDERFYHTLKSKHLAA